MNTIDDRKMRILNAIIDDYILTAAPVGSRTITKKYDIGGLSPATIRNEMSDLEMLGYLEQPHSSSGRVPSAKAYRLYVESLLKTGVALTKAEEMSLRMRLNLREKQMSGIIKNVAAAVSEATGYTTVIAGPKALDMRVRSLQLVPISSSSALMVLVTDSGVFKDATISYDKHLTPDDLYNISRVISEHLAGMLLSDMSGSLDALIAILFEHGKLMVSVLDALGQIELSAQTNREIAVSGGTNIMLYPEYGDIGKVQAFLSALETHDRLRALLAAHGSFSFSLRIGSETGIPELEDCAIVTAAFPTGGEHEGAIGVIGPARMRYAHVLSVLDYIAKALGETLVTPHTGHVD